MEIKNSILILLDSSYVLLVSYWRITVIDSHYKVIQSLSFVLNVKFINSTINSNSNEVLAIFGWDILMQAI